MTPVANEHTIKNYNLQDIKKYHAGELSATEMHSLEKASLEDSFLADALDGYKEEQTDAFAAIHELKTRLSDRIEGATVIPLKRHENFNWWKVAAMIVFIGGAGLLAYQFVGNKKTNDLADNKSAQSIPPADSVTPPANTNVIQG